MTEIKRPHLDAYHQAIWDRHVGDALRKLTEAGHDPNDIQMMTETAFVEPWLYFWTHKCNLCKDVINNKEQTICDTCEKYAVLSNFTGDVHFTIDEQCSRPVRVIFYIKGNKPVITKRAPISRPFSH